MQVTHPNDQTLKAYGLGKLVDEQASSINEHLESCADCRQRVSGLTSDSFLGRFRDGQQPAERSIGGGSLIEGTLSFIQAKAPALPPATDTLPPGLASHPDYEIKRELGRGGMGVVYLAHNTMMGRDEVLKVMGRNIMERPGVLERFQREIRAVAKLRHPNIVAAYHAFRIEGGLVFSMEYVEGLDLSRLVKAKGPLTVAQATYFVHQAALGLQHAHEKGLIHRDIKPHNLMLTHDGKARLVKVLDFGLAKATREEKVDGGLTSEGQALGTPDFIAPEQIVNALDVDIRADLYSLGGTLFYLLMGRPPFQATSLYDIYQAHMSRDAEPLNLIRPEVPAELAALVAKMMAKEPRRRFQTPGEVAEALKPFFKPKAVTLPAEASQVETAKPRSSATFQTQTPSEYATNAAPVVNHGRRSKVVAQTESRSLIDFREPQRPDEESPTIAGSSGRDRGWRWRAVALAGIAFLGLAIMLGVILRIRTSDGGTLIVEVNEPGAVVTVDKQPVIVTWDANRKRAEIRVKPGEREVEVVKDGFTTKGHKVTISNGEREIVKVELDLIASVQVPEKRVDPIASPGEATKKARSKANTFVSHPDYWKTDGDHLLYTGGFWAHTHTLLFGDPSWTDYDFTVKAKLETGALGLVFRSRSPQSQYIYSQGPHVDNSRLEASVLGKTENVILQKEGSTILSNNVWYTLRVRIRGDRIGCFVNDGTGEFKVFDLEDDLHPNGRVGLVCYFAKGRFKDIKVTAPDGTVLWEGVPDGLSRTPKEIDKDSIDPDASIGNTPRKNSHLASGTSSTLSQKSEPAPGARSQRLKLKENTFVSHPDFWKTDGDHLLYTGGVYAYTHTLLFGDPSWTDYDFTVKAKLETGALGLVFRSRSPQSQYIYSQGPHVDNSRVDARVLGKLEQINIIKEGANQLYINIWCDLRVRVRSNRIECYVNNGKGEVKVFDVEDGLHPNGQVGLVCSFALASFREIKVVALDGTVLWEGVPEGLSRIPAKIDTENKSGANQSGRDAKSQGEANAASDPSTDPGSKVLSPTGTKPDSSLKTPGTVKKSRGGKESETKKGTAEKGS